MRARVSSKSLVEALSAIGIVGSLVFVGLQVRQTNSMARAEAFRAMADTYATMALSFGEDEDMAAVFSQAMDGRLSAAEMSESQSFRVATFFTAFLKFHESVYLQVQEGVLDSTALQLLDSPLATNAFVTQNWIGFREHLSDDFASFYEARYGLSN